MRRKSHYLSIVTLVLLFITPMLASAQKFVSDPQKLIENTMPDQLFLKRLDDRSALIMGTFPLFKAGSQVDIVLGKERLFLADDGRNGDERAGDGIFSIKTEFDFDALIKANEMLARQLDGRKLQGFAPGDRQAIGVQTFKLSGEGFAVHEQQQNRVQEFLLPLDVRLLPELKPLPIPVGMLPIGLPPHDIFRQSTSIPHSLMITDISTVNDPDRTWACNGTNQSPTGNATGEWTFWDLMRNMNNGTSSTSDFIKEFFAHWSSNQGINGFIVGARPHVYQQVIEQWEIRSGGPGATLLPEHSPLRLLGIVLRADLRSGGSSFYGGGGGDAGEGRFVFTLHDGDCNNRGKTVILEYKVPISGCANIRNWAQSWKALASSSNYNQDLAQLTNVFTQAGAAPGAPNQSAIGQVRTNEFLPGSPLWELREFVLPDGGGFLAQTTVKQEPHISWNNSSLLADFVNLNWPLLVGPPPAQHTIPEQFNGFNFLAGAAPAPVLWNVPNHLLSVPTNPATPVPATLRDNALFQLALNTCSGCHSNETGTPFAHLDYNSIPGQPAILSGFLTGTSLPDPRRPAVSRAFNDLARRAQDLDAAASMSCVNIRDIAIGNILLHELTTPFGRLHSVH